MRTGKLSFTIAAALLATGCATQNYRYTADSVSSVSVPDRLKGSWTYSIDESIREARRTNFKPGGHPCSFHTFNLDGGAAIQSAIRKGMEEFLERGSEQASGGAGAQHIAFRLDSFQPRFSCAVGMSEGHCTGTAEIALAITLTRNGERRSFTVSSERTADGPGGSMCSTALAAPSEATRKAAKDVVERAMERIITATR